MSTNTKVTMIRADRKTLKSALLGLVLILSPSASLMAQEFSSSRPDSQRLVETASAEPLPSAPGYPALPADTSMFPPLSAIPTPAAAFVIAPVSSPSKAPETHAFWDRENRVLFAATGALATADFFTTHANLSAGGKELNPVARVFAGSTPTLAVNFALETGGVIGLSYFFHRTGHHKLERLTSLVDMGGSAGAVAYGLTHR